MKYLILNTDDSKSEEFDLISSIICNSLIDYNIYSSKNISLSRKVNIFKFSFFGVLFGITFSIVLQYYLSNQYEIGLSSKPIFSLQAATIIIFGLTILSTFIFSIIGFIYKGNLMNWKKNDEIVVNIINQNRFYQILILENLSENEFESLNELTSFEIIKL